MAAILYGQRLRRCPVETCPALCAGQRACLLGATEEINLTARDSIGAAVSLLTPSRRSSGLFLSRYSELRANKVSLPLRCTCFWMRTAFNNNSNKKSAAHPTRCTRTLSRSPVHRAPPFVRSLLGTLPVRTLARRLASRGNDWKVSTRLPGGLTTLGFGALSGA